jgi:peptidyl-prolyl cis-trans isomerase B (cyclophilin B)
MLMKKLGFMFLISFSFGLFAAQPQTEPKTKKKVSKAVEVKKVETVASSSAVQVEMKTNKGEVVFELWPDKAPKTVANFLAYVDSKFYDGTIFHRVIDNFMIQGGGYDQKMFHKTTKDPIQNEADNGLSNDTGTIAMARTSDPHSATAQFFINVKDNANLNHTSKDERGWGYTVFGKVVKGMSVVNTIKKVKTTFKGPMADVPTEEIYIESMKVLK